MTAMIHLMNKPRCSVEDNSMNYSTFRTWPNKISKWKLNNEIPRFGRDKTRLHLRQAFNDCARYVPLTFRKATDDEKVEFSIMDGRIHFDSTEEWTDKYDGLGYNFRLVASHAIGHALGLAHSSDSKALMYPFYQLIQPKDLFPKADRDSIRALYGASKASKPTIFPPMTAVTTIKNKKTARRTTKKPGTTTQKTLSHDRCARYLDVVFGGGPDRWLYTLDYDLVWRYHLDFGHWDINGLPLTDVFPGAEPHMMAGIFSPKTQKTYLFKGDRVWRYSSSNILDPGFPKRLFGTGTLFNPVAVLYEEDHLWLLKGDLLYKFDEDKLQYNFHTPPKRIHEQFPGIPKHVRSAFTHHGKHYFFTEPNRKVYIFDTNTRKLEAGYPKLMTTGWFACKGN